VNLLLLEEGLVVLAVALAAGNEGRSLTVDLGRMGRPMVELNTPNMTGKARLALLLPMFLCWG
jgi:hypothetical protein